MRKPNYRPEYNYQAPEVEVAYNWLEDLKQRKDLPISFAPLEDYYRKGFDKTLNQLMANSFSPPTFVLKQMLRENRELMAEIEAKLDEQLKDLRYCSPLLRDAAAELDPLNILENPADLDDPRNVISNAECLDYSMYSRILAGAEGLGEAARIFEQGIQNSDDSRSPLLMAKRLVSEMGQEYDGLSDFLDDEYIDPAPYYTQSTTPPPLLNGEGIGTINGKVTYKGKPVKDAFVISDRGASVKTDDNGNFTIRNIPTGRYILVAKGKVVENDLLLLEVTQRVEGSATVVVSKNKFTYAEIEAQGIPASGFDLPSRFNPGKGLEDAASIFINDCVRNQDVVLNLDLHFKLPNPPINFSIGNILFAKFEWDRVSILNELNSLLALLTDEFLEALRTDLTEFLMKSICDANTLAWILSFRVSSLLGEGSVNRWSQVWDGVVKHNALNKLEKGEVAEKIKDMGNAIQQAGQQLNNILGQIGAMTNAAAGAVKTTNWHTVNALKDQALQIFWETINKLKDEALGLGGVYLQQIALNFMANMICLNMSTLIACLNQLQATMTTLPVNNTNTRIPDNWEAFTPQQKDAYLAKNFNTIEDAESELKKYEANKATNQATKSVFEVLQATTERRVGEPMNIGLSSFPTANFMVTSVEEQFAGMTKKLENFADNFFVVNSFSGETRAKIVNLIKETLFIKQIITKLQTVQSVIEQTRGGYGLQTAEGDVSSAVKAGLPPAQEN